MCFLNATSIVAESHERRFIKFLLPSGGRILNITGTFADP